MQIILEHWSIPAALLPLFLDHPDGLAVLALLCNAGAKDWPDRSGNPQLFQSKAEVVARACLAAGADRSWATTHVYARTARWPWLTRLNVWWRGRTGAYLFGAEQMSILFIETGLRLDGQPLQLAFHFRAGDRLPGLPEDWPPAGARGWRRQQAQPRALEIAQSYLSSRGVVMG